MKKEKKNELEKQGFTILRGQWTKKGWHVVKRTAKGAWEAIDLKYYATVQECDLAIKTLVEKFPDKYVFDN